MEWLDGGHIIPEQIGKTIETVLTPLEKEARDSVAWWQTRRGQKISLGCSIDMTEHESVTIYGFEVVQVVPGESVLLAQGSQGRLFRNCAIEKGSWSTFISMCSGMGGGILGVDAAGFRCLGALDHSALAVASLKRNFQFPVHCGKVNDVASLVALHEAKGEMRCWGEAGFPCQPYSRLGDQKGFGDSRAWTLVSILRASWLLQLRGLILECVPGAGTNAEVARFLDEISSVLHLKRSEVVLHLERAWPSRRSRWWTIMFPGTWADMHLEDMPQFQEWQTVGKLFPCWPLWQPEEEAQLSWSADENALFKDPAFGNIDRRLSLTGKAPTLLHSMGNHASGCPCGCRTNPFAVDRLRQGGIHLVEVVSEVLGGASRHLHPREASLLQGIPDQYHHDSNMRGALCLIGQVASPLQGEWIGLSLRELIAKEVGCIEPSPISLSCLLHESCADLVAVATNTWLTERCLEGGECLLRMWPGVDLPMRFDGGMQVADLIQAQKDLSRDEEIWKVWRDGTLLQPEAFLRSGSYYVGTTSLTSSTASHDITEVIFTFGEEQIHTTGLKSDFLFTFVPIDMHSWFSTMTCVTPDGTTFPWGRVVGESFNFQVLPLLHGQGSKTQGILTKILKDDELQITLRLRHAQGNAPPLDEGLDDVTIACAMRTLFEEVKDPTVCWFEPRRIAEWLALPYDEAVDGVSDALAFFNGERIIAIVGDDAHWAVVDYQSFDQGSEIAYVDGIPDRLLPQAELLGKIFHAAYGRGSCSLTKASCFLQDGGDQCGAVALLHLGWRLNLWPIFHAEDVQAWYKSLRWGARMPLIFGGGASGNDDALRARLGEILTSKGADSHNVHERIHQALRLFGAAKLETALRAKNPWQALKSLGSSQSKQFHWITYDELQKHIEQNGRRKWGAEVDQGRKPKQGKDKKGCEFYLDPVKLQMIPGFWTDGTNSIEQIEFAQVKAGSTGVAFCKIEDALPYVQAGTTISVDALMLLTVGQIPEEIDGLRFAHIDVPAKYAGTGEPVVLRCTSLQLGDVDVVLADGDVAPTLNACPTEVVRLRWFRDECSLDWNEVSRRPIKQLVATMPMLTLCRDPGCSQCGRFHPAVEEEGIDSVMLDLWSWKWATTEGKKSKPWEADVFQLFIRCPESVLQVLLEASGDQGVYFEPRQNSGFGPHPTYAIVWIAGGTHRQVLHVAKTDEQVIGIARLGHRFGLRTLDKHAEAVHQRHCPQKPFLKGAITQIYRLEPLPVGTQRTSLAELLQQFGWNAKPLQAARGSHGRAWEVGTADEPPSEVLKIKEGYVMITKQKVLDYQPKQEQVLASSKTKLQIRKDASSSADSPWSPEGDPWAQWRKNNPAVAPTPAIPAGEAKSKIEAVEKRLHQNVADEIKNQIQEITKESEAAGSAKDSRMQKLEVQIGELQNQSQRFETFFQESKKVTENHQQCITELQGVCAQQVDSVNRLQKTVETCTQQIEDQRQQVQHLSVEFSTFQGGLSGHLSELFSQQMQHFEALLEKREETDVKRLKTNP